MTVDGNSNLMAEDWNCLTPHSLIRFSHEKVVIERIRGERLVGLLVPSPKVKGGDLNNKKRCMTSVFFLFS